MSKKKICVHLQEESIFIYSLFVFETYEFLSIGEYIMKEQSWVFSNPSFSNNLIEVSLKSSIKQYGVTPNASK